MGIEFTTGKKLVCKDAEKRFSWNRCFLRKKVEQIKDSLVAGNIIVYLSRYL